MHLGPTIATYAFYLPNAPERPENWHSQRDNAIAELIVLNGNHWRKIFTIMAKICTNGEDWRHYRDHLLLKKHEMLLIGANALSPHASIHIVCGQAAAKPLGLSAERFNTPLSNLQTVHQPLLHESQGKLQDVTEIVQTSSVQKEQVLLTPYLDYRQYSNALIALTRSHIKNVSA